MASSKDNQEITLVGRSTNPQVVAHLGIQDGYPPIVPMGGLQPGHAPPFTTQPGCKPAPYPNNINLSYPQNEIMFSQGPPYPQDKTSQVHPQRGYLQEGVYVQGGQPQETPPLPPGFKPDFDNSNIYMAEQTGENGLVQALDFTEKTIRRAFIRKVYGILTCQLLVTICFISLFVFYFPIRMWAPQNRYMLVIAFVVYFAMAFSMICCSEVRRKAPMNLIFLGLFTVATGYMLGVITSTYNVDSVMIAVGITAAVVLSLTLFALQTKYDFTGMGGSLLCALVILLMMGIMCPIMPNKTLNILYASIGALIFSLYIVYDTQLMLGGNHKYTISPEEYIFAALNLYLDTINLFIKILTLFGRR
ncbi:protein lifeguard 1-like [Plodia interpunctella]|uniref:protein lifeguard 1-like n=1 Tax=Plodia interpunctella TaxID=58824 RepID=UPI0023687CAF|nr:protein lifeguard 1-like [Plodia interpunctella]